MQAQSTTTLLIDDFSSGQSASNGNQWRFFSDAVMDGISQGYARHETLAGRPALHLQGNVSLENNGGFIQMALDLGPDEGLLDASGYRGIAVTQRGDGGAYAVNLRTADVRRPWQSYRCEFQSTAEWTTLQLPFADLQAHRIDSPLDIGKLRRIGLIAIGRSGPADLAVARLEFYP
jgi:hypothetical protein